MESSQRRLPPLSVRQLSDHSWRKSQLQPFSDEYHGAQLFKLCFLRLVHGRKRGFAEGCESNGHPPISNENERPVEFHEHPADQSGFSLPRRAIQLSNNHVRRTPQLRQLLSKPIFPGPDNYQDVERTIPQCAISGKNMDNWPRGLFYSVSLNHYCWNF
jgi:hypothetical protein